MLRHISIRDFAIISELSIDLNDGMCVLTGETGAGKSILIDALGLVLGNRADSDLIRQTSDHIAERLEVTALFEISGHNQVGKWLIEHDMEAEGECILRRVVSRDGRSRAYINGSITTLASLRELGGMLVEIYGQHEHHSLMRRDKQRDILDTHANSPQSLQQVTTAFHDWQELYKRVELLSSNQQERGERRDLLRFQLNELEQLSPLEDELTTLESQHARLAYTEQLLNGTQSIFNALYEDENSLYSEAARQLNELIALSVIDTQLQSHCESLESAQVLIHDCAESIRDYADGMETDPQELQRIEQRLATYHDLARKHRVKPQALAALFTTLQTELHKLDDPQTDIDQLEQQLADCAKRYTEAASRLTKIRLASAKNLGTKVTALMHELGMHEGRFAVDVHTSDEHIFSAHGLDEIEFRISTNSGQPLKPLGKIASGGELSRISLAIQVAGVQSQNVGTLIFDEVDSGIGGSVAEIVGRKLRLLADNYQVLCVTHLPQVAVQGHAHYQVQKDQQNGKTSTSIIELGDNDRVHEIARMLGGVEMTEKTQKHASEMLLRAHQNKEFG